MIKLYGFGSSFNLLDPSPFVVKTNLMMRVAGIEFETVNDAGNLQKAPKGKLPFIDDNGTIVADSYFIANYLSQKYGMNLDAHLDDEERALAYLLGKSLEENLYWCIVYSRWIDENVWPTIRAAFFDEMPFPLKKIVPLIARRNVRNSLNGHGMGRHGPEEVMQIAKHSLQSLSAYLDNKPYFFGEKISSLDITAFAMISSLTQANLETPINELAKTFDNLVDFAARIRQEYYPELV